MRSLGQERSPPLALPDHVHFSDEGSRRIGQAIYEALMSGYDAISQTGSRRRRASADEPARPA